MRRICTIVLLFASVSVYAADATEKFETKSNQANPVLLEVISSLADPATFRKTGEDLDKIFSKHCSKKDVIKEKSGIDIRYDCDEIKSGIKSVHFDSREWAGKPNYLMYLTIDFGYPQYAEIKSLLTKKLGSAQRKKDKDYTGWIFRKDKFLNEIGTPVIDVSRDKQYNVGTFNVALEQGDN